MAIPQEGSLPANFTLAGGMSVRVTAIDPVTGALVAGVQVAGVSIDVDERGSARASSPPPNPLLVPSTV